MHPAGERSDLLPSGDRLLRHHSTQVSARAMSPPRAENWTLASSVTVQLFLAEHDPRPPGVVLWGVIEPSWAWANRRCAFRAASNALEPPAPEPSKEHGRPGRGPHSGKCPA